MRSPLRVLGLLLLLSGCAAPAAREPTAPPKPAARARPDEPDAGAPEGASAGSEVAGDRDAAPPLAAAGELCLFSPRGARSPVEIMHRTCAAGLTCCTPSRRSARREVRGFCQESCAAEPTRPRAR